MTRRFAVFLVLAAWACCATAAVRVTLVADPAPAPPVRHGLSKLKLALEARGVVVDQAAEAIQARGDQLVVARLDPSLGAEALTVRRVRLAAKPAWVAAGGDERGLMYALLDLADRTAWSAGPDPFQHVRETTEKPAVSERALPIYTMHRAYFESRLFDDRYWARYFDELARHRFNSFVVIFGYENAGYFAPAYPYFFDVEGFPGVRVTGFSREMQQRYTAALRRMIRLAHDRGLRFTAGLWDHIYRGGVQGPVEFARQPTPGVVWGLNEQNLTTYIRAALTRFLQEFPEIDAIQFRMHNESGLKNSEMRGFWEDMYQAMQRYGAGKRFDFRVKEFPDELIHRAVELKLNFRLATKYWAEQMGLPWHPTRIPKPNQHDRRHSYADLLRYPRSYAMHWRLWTGGTTRLLLWGSPDFARRFAESSLLLLGRRL